MLDISNFWLLFDVLAALFIVLNIFLMVKKYNKFTIHIAFLSIASVILNILLTPETPWSSYVVTTCGVLWLLSIQPFILSFKIYPSEHCVHLELLADGLASFLHPVFTFSSFRDTSSTSSSSNP